MQCEKRSERSPPFAEFAQNVQEEEGDDTPGSEIDGDGITDLGGIGRCLVGFSDAKPRDQDAGKREPERAIGSEGYYFPRHVIIERK